MRAFAVAVLAIGGGYGVIWLAVATGAALLTRWGLPRGEAVAAAGLAGLPLYALLLMAALATARPVRLAVALALAALALALALWAVTPSGALP